MYTQLFLYYLKYSARNYWELSQPHLVNFALWFFFPPIRRMLEKKNTHLDELQ